MTRFTILLILVLMLVSCTPPRPVEIQREPERVVRLVNLFPDGQARYVEAE